MSKRCSRCEKTVYPIEELKCLDKVWHKGCFKCQECGMTLSMKTYKGFNKLPYCEAHIPKAKATAVAETPEMKRLAENTKIQSNVQYHADFEKNKAKFTQVADDPETRRIKQNTKIISNVSYHGELEKKAMMERKRSDPNTEEEILAVVPTHDEFQPEQSSQNLPLQQSHSIPHSQPMTHTHSAQTSHPHPHHSYRSGGPAPSMPVQATYSGMPAASNHANPQQPYYQAQPHPHSHHHTQNPSSNHMYEQHQPPPAQSSNYYHKGPGVNNSNANTHSYHHHPDGIHQNLYQDANHNSPYSARNSQTLIYSSQTGPVQQPVSNRVGSIADYDPVNEQYGSIAQKRNPASHPGHRQETTYQGQRSHLYPEGNQNYQQSGQANQMPRHSQPMQHKVNAPPTQLGRCYRAIYDYEAADTDEVSFRDGDLLTNCTSIDEGWMLGTVQRTGRMGMLPANYVERAS